MNSVSDALLLLMPLIMPIIISAVLQPPFITSTLNERPWGRRHEGRRINVGGDRARKWD